MTKIDIFSGFLGAGKTTLIKKLISEAYKGQKLVLIENEFGEIGIDGGFLRDAGIEITEMNSGCICCSLVGDFREALKKVIDQYHPDRILIEPSGVGKLSDVTRAVMAIADERDIQLNSFATVADVNKVKMYMKNFGEFYNDQISHANAIILSRTADTDPAKVKAAVALLREQNKDAVIVTTDWTQLDGAKIVEAMEEKQDFAAQLLEELKEHEQEHHHHHHDEDECGCGHEHHHHHHHDEDECGCGHEHHHDHEHHHEHHYDEHGVCSCGHHHHHADDVFTSFGRETTRTFTADEIEEALAALDTGAYGMVLRAKGILPGADKWVHFDYVPGEADVRQGGAEITGKLCVIGSGINEDKLEQLFHLV